MGMLNFFRSGGKIAWGLIGAILLLISLSINFNLAAFVLEAAWGAIAAVGLVLALRKSLSRSREGLGVGQSDEGRTSPPPAPPASGRGDQ